MSHAVAIQMDPMDSIDIDADSTFVLALEAQKRGHALFHYLPRDMALRDGRVLAEGPTAGVLTTESVAALYGVRADVRFHASAGHLTVVPLGREPDAAGSHR